MKKIKLLLVLSVFLLFKMAFADNNYNVQHIQEELKKDANAVVRINSLIFNVLSVGEATQTVKYAVAILNQNGDRYSQFGVAYNKLKMVKADKAKLVLLREE